MCLDAKNRTTVGSRDVTTVVRTSELRVKSLDPKLPTLDQQAKHVLGSSAETISMQIGDNRVHNLNVPSAMFLLLSVP